MRMLAVLRRRVVVVAVVVAAAAVAACVDALPIDELACDYGGAAVGTELLPLVPGTCWQNLVKDPRNTRATQRKQTSISEPTDIPAEPGDACPNLDVARGDAIPLKRTVTDGSSALRFMSVDRDDNGEPAAGGAVWWELDVRRDGDGSIMERSVYCDIDEDGRIIDGHKLRVPSARDIERGRFAYHFVEIEATPTGTTQTSCDDVWEVAAGLDHRVVPAGAFDVAKLMRTRTCTKIDPPPDDVELGSSITKEVFEFAPGVGKVFEEKAELEIEELMTWRIGGGGG